MAKKPPKPQRTGDEIRQILLEFFYDRAKNATSKRGARGLAAKIGDIRAGLKASHGLTQQEIWLHLTYLISEGWVEEESVEKSVTLPKGTEIKQATAFYKITARGIDRIEGGSSFTTPKFHGVNIQATGQNIITLGDGNQVNVLYQGVAGGLIKFKEQVVASSIPDSAKLDIVADIETIQTQLAKEKPNAGIVRAAWESIKDIAVAVGLGVDVTAVGKMLSPLLQ